MYRMSDKVAQPKYFHYNINFWYQKLHETYNEHLVHFLLAGYRTVQDGLSGTVKCLSQVGSSLTDGCGTVVYPLSRVRMLVRTGEQLR